MQLEESHALLEDACNQKEEKDARIEELEEQLESLQQDRDQLAKEVNSLKGTATEYVRVMAVLQSLEQDRDQLRSLFWYAPALDSSSKLQSLLKIAKYEVLVE